MVSAHRMLAILVVFSILVACLGQDADLHTQDQDASCTTDIARDGTRCRCDSPCDYHGGSYNLWCRIDYKGGERYCCKKKCTLRVRQNALTPASQLLYKCAAGDRLWGILVECNIDKNTLNPHGK